MDSRSVGRSWRSLALVVGLVLVVACSSEAERGPTAEGGYLPPQPDIVTVTMVEHRFVYARGIDAGRVVFEVTNSGSLRHQFSVIPLPDEGPPIEEVVAEPGFEPEPLMTMPVLGSGEADAAAVELQPGARYAMVSLWPSPEGSSDAALGLAAEFTTPAA